MLPRQLRSALLRSVFFDGPSLPYLKLLDRVPSRASAVEALVAAKHRGAAIPDRELRELVLECGSRRTWEQVAAVNSEFAEWAPKDYPGDLCDVAGAALRVSPEATIPRLLQRAVGETRTTNEWARHPMRILSGWTREFGTPDRILGRRRLLARTAKRFLVEGGERAFCWDPWPVSCPLSRPRGNQQRSRSRLKLNNLVRSNSIGLLFWHGHSMGGSPGSDS